MGLHRVKLLLLVATLAALARSSDGYSTEAPDFSNEPPTTLPPLTPQQQIYVNMLNAINANAPGGGNQNIVQQVSNG